MRNKVHINAVGLVDDKSCFPRLRIEIPSLFFATTDLLIMWSSYHLVNFCNSGHGPYSRYRAVINWFGKGRLSGGATASKNGPKTSAIETSTIRSSISLEIREPSCWAISLFVRKTKLDSTRTPSGVPASGQCGRSHYHTTDPEERFQWRTRSHVRNEHNTKLCYVYLTMEILIHFIRLVGWNYTTPLAIYYAGSGIVQSITANNIELVMCAAAAHIYSLSQPPNLPVGASALVGPLDTGRSVCDPPYDGFRGIPDPVRTQVEIHGFPGLPAKPFLYGIQTKQSNP